MRTLLVLVIGCKHSHQQAAENVAKVEELYPLDPYTALQPQGFDENVLKLVHAVDIVFVVSKMEAISFIVSTYAQSIGKPTVHSWADLLTEKARILQHRYG